MRRLNDTDNCGRTLLHWNTQTKPAAEKNKVQKKKQKKHEMQLRKENLLKKR